MSSDSDVSEEEQLIPLEQSVQKGVRRTLTLLDGVTMIVGVMIGSGIFISPASVLVNSGSVVCWWCYCSICIPVLRRVRNNDTQVRG